MREFFARIPKWIRIAGLAVAGIAFSVFAALVFAYFVMRLWNWIMPDLLGAGTLTFWKGFGIVVLARLIFGSLGPSGKAGKARKGGKREWRDGKGHRWSYDGWGEWNEDRCRQEWKQYDIWWKQEGKAAFERFKSEDGEKPSGEDGSGA